MNFREALLVLLIMLGVTVTGLVAYGAAPTAGNLGKWTSADNGNPEISDAVAQGDDHMRDIKTRLFNRLRTEHHIGERYDGSQEVSDDNGLHRLGSARCFYDNTAPTAIKHKDWDYTTGESAGLKNLDVVPSSDTLTQDIGEGRCWIDIDGADNLIGTTADNYTLNVWNDTDDTWQIPGGTGSSFPRGHLVGLGISSPTGTDLTFTVATGEARVGTLADQDLSNATLTSSFTKELGDDWVTGATQDCLVNGLTLTSNTWYGVFLISKTDGTLDVACDTDPDFTNGIADADIDTWNGGAGWYWRRIGWILNRVTDIKDFTQVGDRFAWNEMDVDEAAAPVVNVITDAQIIAGVDIALLFAPPSVEFHAIWAQAGMDTGSRFNIEETTMGTHDTAQALNNGIVYSEAIGFGFPTTSFTDEDREVHIKAGSIHVDSAQNVTVYSGVRFWHDPRGRFD